MADCNRHRFPRQLEKLLKINRLNTLDEVADIFFEVNKKEQKKFMNELAKIVASPQQRMLTENDFNRLSDPAHAEIAKRIFREYDRTKPEEDLSHYMLRKAMDVNAYETIFQPLVLKFNSGNQELIESITQAFPIILGKHSTFADSILVNGKIMKEPKQRHIDVNSFSLN